MCRASACTCMTTLGFSCVGMNTRFAALARTLLNATAEDINTARGFTRHIWSICNLQRGGLAFGGVVCSSWTLINRSLDAPLNMCTYCPHIRRNSTGGTSGRTRDNPMGNPFLALQRVLCVCMRVQLCACTFHASSCPPAPSQVAAFRRLCEFDDF